MQSIISVNYQHPQAETQAQSFIQLEDKPVDLKERVLKERVLKERVLKERVLKERVLKEKEESLGGIEDKFLITRCNNFCNKFIKLVIKLL